MPASLLQTLPSARLLAAALVMAASLLHFTGFLPARGWATALPTALPILVLAGALVVKRARPALLALIRTGIAVMLVGPLVVWQVHEALEKRIPAALEGLDLEVTGVVDAMPQRFDFGDRVRFTLSGCRVLGLEGARAAGEMPGTAACGRLERLQLDWGPLRAKDRKVPATASAGDPATEAAAEAGDEAAGGDGDGAGDGSEYPADELRGMRKDRLREADRPASVDAWRDDIWPEPGQYWRLTVRLKRPVANANPGGFDLELRYLQQGVGAIGRVQARQRLALSPPGLAWRAGPRILTAFESLRSRLRDRLEAVFAHRVDAPGTAGSSRWPLLGIVSGLAIGDQAAISASLWGLFSRTGVSHLMAISGMHVTMLALIAAWLAARSLRFVAARRMPGLSRLLGFRPRQVLVLVVAVLAAFGYALLSGWGIPSQRTCWMLSAAATMSISGRGRGSLDVTLLAAGVVVLVDPWAPSTAGFWLSFGAVAAILWCAHGHDGQGALHMPSGRTGGVRIPSAVREAVTGQWAATIGLAPLVVALFSILSVIGPLANAVAIPWVSFVVTPLSVAAVLLAPLSEPLCAVLLQVNLWMIEHLVTMLKLLDSWPAASVAISRPGLWAFLAAAVGATVLIAPPGMPMRGAGLLCLLPMLLTPRQVPPRDELWITVLDIGQGSSILIEAGDDRLLFDAGAGSGPEKSAASRHLVPYLHSRGIERIDTLVVSHLDVEHAGGAAAVMQGLQPSRLLTAFDAALLQPAPETLSLASRLTCTTGQRFSLGDATIEVLHPAAAAKSRAAARDNASSCVLRIASPAGSVLLPGDLPTTAEAAMIRSARAAGNENRASIEGGRSKEGGRGVKGVKDNEDGGALQADVLVVPQQGSRQAAGAALLAAVRPSFAVLQVGYRNRHRHPHPAVLERLLATGAVLLRTDHDGAVQIRLRAARPAQVYRIRRDAPPYWRLDAAATGREPTAAAGGEAAPRPDTPATAPSSPRR